MKLNDLLKKYGRHEAERQFGIPHYRAKKILPAELKYNVLEIYKELYTEPQRRKHGP